MPDAEIAPVAPVKFSDVTIRKNKKQDDRVALGLHKFRSKRSATEYLYGALTNALEDAWRAGAQFDKSHANVMCSYIAGAYSLLIDGAIKELVRLEIADRIERLSK